MRASTSLPKPLSIADTYVCPGLAPPGQEGRTERPQAISRSILLARRVVDQVREKFLVWIWSTTQSAPLRILRKISLVAASPPGQEARSRWLPGGLVILVALGLKAFYTRANADQLLWVLAPSAWLARFLGGLDLAYERGAGFISHAHHMVVGPPCAGVNFLVICFLCLYFSFARHFPSKARWLLTSLVISYCATIAANSLRIFVSAHLWDATFYRAWLTQDGMHRLAGITIYYASLLALYVAAESRLRPNTRPIAPLAWYLAISLGVPLTGRLLSGGTPGFGRHAGWVVGVAAVLTLVKVLPSMLRNRIHFRT